jgi:hypothetical protein
VPVRNYQPRPLRHGRILQRPLLAAPALDDCAFTILRRCDLPARSRPKSLGFHAEVRPPSPATPGQIAKRDGEYKRCGTANVFCAVEPKGGRHFTLATPNRSGSEFAKAVDLIVRRYPDAQTVHLVMDNLNINCRKSLTDYFGIEYGSQLWDRLTVHYTPKHGSWLNQAEIEISLFARQCLGSRRIPDLNRLRREAKAWSRRMNRRHVTINNRVEHSSSMSSPDWIVLIWTQVVTWRLRIFMAR